MIKVNVKANEITISGHAYNDISGKDIVCASVSSIVIATINAIIRIDEKAIVYEEKDGYIKINNLKKDHITNSLLINMTSLLRELVSKYPKNIIMKEDK